MTKIKYLLMQLIMIALLMSCSKTEEIYLDEILVPNIEGKWEGTLNANGWINKFIFEMELEQDGIDITGQSKISFEDNPSSFAVILLEATFVQEKLTFTELSIIEQDNSSAAFQWCIKEGILNYQESGSDEFLIGGWFDTTTCENHGEINIAKR